MVPRVLISDALSPAAVQIFKDRGVEVDFQPKLGADKDKLAELIGQFDGLAIRSATKVTPKILEKAKKLKVIGRAVAGNVLQGRMLDAVPLADSSLAPTLRTGIPVIAAKRGFFSKLFR